LSRPPPESCPVCGEEVPRDALACPECGADERSGWSEDADHSAELGLPDGEFDHEDFVRREFGGGEPQGGIAWVWWAAGVAALLGLIATLLRGAW
jgi:hypothetical protein